jgi:hypothetical protein
MASTSFSTVGRCAASRAGANGVVRAHSEIVRDCPRKRLSNFLYQQDLIGTPFCPQAL